MGRPGRNRRGELLLDLAQSLNLNILNDGKYPTLIRHNGSSYIDVTMVNEEAAKRKPVWKVLTNEPSSSDHNFILIKISDKKRKMLKPTQTKLTLNMVAQTLKNLQKG